MAGYKIISTLLLPNVELNTRQVDKHGNFGAIQGGAWVKYPFVYETIGALGDGEDIRIRSYSERDLPKNLGKLRRSFMKVVGIALPEYHMNNSFLYDEFGFPLFEGGYVASTHLGGKSPDNLLPDEFDAIPFSNDGKLSIREDVKFGNSKGIPLQLPIHNRGHIVRARDMEEVRGLLNEVHGFDKWPDKVMVQESHLVRT